MRQLGPARSPMCWRRRVCRVTRYRLHSDGARMSRGARSMRVWMRATAKRWTQGDRM